MQYRRLGTSGLKISEVSLGSWLTYGGATEMDLSRQCLLKAYELGINHFDCAVAYGNRPHEAEEVLGALLKEFPRNTYTVTSKFYWKVGPSTYDQGLSRKTLFDRVDISLTSLDLDYIDIYYCHRFDPDTDLEETLRALDDLVTLGKIRYYGISEWTVPQIEAMMEIVDRRNLRRPVVNQPGYNMFRRDVESQVLDTCATNGLGVVAFSPLAQGLLTGKYRPGTEITGEVRAADPKRGRMLKESMNEERLTQVQRLIPIAEGLNLSVSQLALAWVLRRPELTSALIGASRPEQVEENVKAAGVSLSDETLGQIEQIITN